MRRRFFLVYCLFQDRMGVEHKRSHLTKRTSFNFNCFFKIQCFENGHFSRHRTTEWEFQEEQRKTTWRKVAGNSLCCSSALILFLILFLWIWHTFLIFFQLWSSRTASVANSWFLPNYFEMVFSSLLSEKNSLDSLISFLKFSAWPEKSRQLLALNHYQIKGFIGKYQDDWAALTYYQSLLNRPQ